MTDQFDVSRTVQFDVSRSSALTGGWMDDECASIKERAEVEQPGGVQVVGMPLVPRSHS